MLILRNQLGRWVSPELGRTLVASAGNLSPSSYYYGPPIFLERGYSLTVSADLDVLTDPLTAEWRSPIVIDRSDRSGRRLQCFVLVMIRPLLSGMIIDRPRMPIVGFHFLVEETILEAAEFYVVTSSAVVPQGYTSYLASTRQRVVIQQGQVEVSFNITTIVKSYQCVRRITIFGISELKIEVSARYIGPLMVPSQLLPLARWLLR